MSEVREDVTEAWPLQGQLDALESHDPDEVRGAARLGALAFDEVPDQLRQVIKDLRDLKLEDWDGLPAALVAQLPEILNQMNADLGQMEGLSSAVADFASIRGTLATRTTENFQRFRTIVHPLTVRARIRDELATGGALGQGAGELQERIAALSDQAAKLDAQMARLAPIAEAQRDAVLESGTAELGAAYEAEATRHDKAWRRWLSALIVIGVVAAGAGLWFVSVLEPERDATNAQVATAIARDVLFVGLLLFAVRIASLQFRVHRHLEAVARNKAAALGTFNRLVTGQTDPDVRAAVAAALAQAVFSSDQTGFIGTTDDHVTLIEKVMARS